VPMAVVMTGVALAALAARRLAGARRRIGR
jgi:hypothetical protein